MSPAGPIIVVTVVGPVAVLKAVFVASLVVVPFGVVVETLVSVTTVAFVVGVDQILEKPTPHNAALVAPVKVNLPIEGLANCEVMSTMSDAIEVRNFSVSISVVVVVAAVVVVVVDSPLVFVVVLTAVVMIGAPVTLVELVLTPIKSLAAKPRLALTLPPIPVFVAEDFDTASVCIRTFACAWPPVAYAVPPAEAEA